MKILIRTVLIIIYVFLLTPASYAGEIYLARTLIEAAFPDYQENSGLGHAAEKKTLSLAFADYDNAASGRFSLSGERNKRVAAYHKKEDDTSYNSRMDIYNLPPSLVNNITYDFSNDKYRKTSGHSLFEWPSGLTDVIQIGAAFLTNLAVHEFGHEVVANYAGAEGSRLNFFQKSGGDFFLGTSHVDKIDERSVLPYTMGGEFFADLTFEHALKDYRNNPNTYNKSLLISSGADFLWYCLYAFYISGDNPSYDPITISKETGISRDTLFSVALAKTMINAYRVYSGNDVLVPYFRVDKYSASLNIMIPFDIGS
jgi:hypothetical protein